MVKNALVRIARGGALAHNTGGHAWIEYFGGRSGLGASSDADGERCDNEAQNGDELHSEFVRGAWQSWDDDDTETTCRRIAELLISYMPVQRVAVASLRYLSPGAKMAKSIRALRR